MINSLKMFLWGFVSLHTQLLLVFALFYYLPRGGMWESLIFLLFIIVFALNVMGSYLIGVFVLFGDEDAFADSAGLIGFWALLGFIFAPMTANNLAYYLHYKEIKPQTVALDTHAVAQAGKFIKLEKAQILHAYTHEKDVYHTRSSGKSGTTRYQVHYKLCPIVPENWQEGQPISFFLAYNNDEYLEKDFKLAYTLKTYTSDRYGYQYHKIVQELIAKHDLPTVGKPVFLEMIDVQKLQNIGWWYCRLFYGLMMGIWFAMTVLVLLQPKSTSTHS